MRKLLLALALLPLAACATVDQGTPAQRLYEAQASYGVALAAAVDYAESPTAAPGIVHELNVANKAVQPALAYSRGFILCRGSNVPSTAAVDCAKFDFRPTTISSYAIVLRSAAVSILTRIARTETKP